MQRSWFLAIAHMVVGLIVPGRGADAIIGDLREEADRRRLSPLWVLREALKIAVRMLFARLWGVPVAFNPEPSRKGDSMMSGILQDVRFALRGFRNNPGLAGVAILTLALGIGANTAVFSIVDDVLLKSLPYPEPERMVRIYSTWEQSDRGNVSPMDFLDWQDQSSSFSAVAAVTAEDYAHIGEGEPEVVFAAEVTPGFFDVVAVDPALGRPFISDDGVARAAPVAVLSDGFWQRSFGGDPDVVGRSLSLETGSVMIVGVMPPGFVSPGWSDPGPDFWINMVLDRSDNNRGGHFLGAIGRLKTDVGLGTVVSEMDLLGRELAELYPNTNLNRSIRIVPLDVATFGEVRPAAIALLASVAIVLLIGCSNVANLLLARGTAREREMALRVALGARRGRIVRLLLTECMVLSIVGAGTGLFLASRSIPILKALGPAGLVPATAGIDGRVLAFTAAVSLVTALVFGLAPAIRASQSQPDSALHGAGAHSMGRGRGFFGRFLVTVEVSLAVVLLIGAALLARSLGQLLDVDPGFKTENVATVKLYAPAARYPGAVEVAAFYDTIHSSLASIPGVGRVGAVNRVPLSQSYSCDGFSLGDREPFPIGQGPCAEERRVAGDYFRAMGVPLITGRAFDRSDNASAPPVVIINETMASRHWPDEDPLGKPFKWGDYDNSSDWSTIVGVVGDVRHFGLEVDASPEVYAPLSQQATRTMVLILAADGDPASLMPAVRERIWAEDPLLPMRDVSTMEERVAGTVAGRRFLTALPATFALLAMVLAAVGIYGIVSYSVTQRYREIGIRMALGAGSPAIIRMVVRQGLLPTLIGVGIGLGVALLGAHLAEGLLFGVSATDPVSFAAVPLGLLLIAAIASYVPARRAVDVDPLTTLKYE